MSGDPEDVADDGSVGRLEQASSDLPPAAGADVDTPDAQGPEAVALRHARAAFDAGDYELARRLLRSLETSDPSIREEAHALRRRMSIDPFQIVVLLGCLAFFVWIAAHYF